MRLLDEWNKQPFSIYTSEERGVLGLLKRLGKWVGKLIEKSDEVEQIAKDNQTKKVSHEQMKKMYKMEYNNVTDNTDFTGSWFGIKSPTFSEPGIANVVEKIRIFIDKFFTNDTYALIEKFGAVGDGITDDTQALRNYINYVNENNKKIAYIPNGYTFKVTDVINCEKEIKIYSVSGVINHEGLGDCFVFGKDGYIAITGKYGLRFEIEGVSFIGGKQATSGIRFKNMVTIPRVYKCSFNQFGNRHCWNIKLDGDNWDTFIKDTSCYSSGIDCKFIYADNPTRNSSKIRIVDCHYTAPSAPDVDYRNVMRKGIFIQGFNSLVSNCTIEGCSPAIQLGTFSDFTVIENCYGELPFDSNLEEVLCFIGIGDDVQPDQQIYKLTVRDCYCSLHRESVSTIKKYFLAPMNDKAYLTQAIFENIECGGGNVNNGDELIKLNDLPYQDLNTVKNYKPTNAKVLTEGSKIKPWYGYNKGDILSLENNVMRKSVYYADEVCLDLVEVGNKSEQNYIKRIKEKSTGNTVYQCEVYPNGLIIYSDNNGEVYRVQNKNLTLKGDIYCPQNISAQSIQLNGKTPSTIGNNQFFIQDGILKFKDNGGTIRTVNLT